MTALTSAAAKAVERLTQQLDSTRGRVMILKNSAGESLAAKTTSEHSGISTTRLRMVIVTPKDSPKPGMMLCRLFRVECFMVFP